MRILLSLLMLTAVGCVSKTEPPTWEEVSRIRAERLADYPNPEMIKIAPDNLGMVPARLRVPSIADLRDMQVHDAAYIRVDDLRCDMNGNLFVWTGRFIYDTTRGQHALINIRSTAPDVMLATLIIYPDIDGDYPTISAKDVTFDPETDIQIISLAMGKLDDAPPVKLSFKRHVDD